MEREKKLAASAKGLELLRQKGYKITPQRRAVLEALDAGCQFPTAQQVLELVREKQPDVSLDTVYRNLTLMVSLGIVHEIFRSAGNA